MAYRVVADHIRACTFALADGATFSNEGRGYVLRRLLRRASLYLRKLGIDKPYLYTLVPLVCSVMNSYYPYLKEHEDKVSKMIKFEEEKFSKTLKGGQELILDADYEVEAATLADALIYLNEEGAISLIYDDGPYGMYIKGIGKEEALKEDPLSQIYWIFESKTNPACATGYCPSASDLTIEDGDIIVFKQIQY